MYQTLTWHGVSKQKFDSKVNFFQLTNAICMHNIPMQGGWHAQILTAAILVYSKHLRTLSVHRYSQ